MGIEFAQEAQSSLQHAKTKNWTSRYATSQKILAITQLHFPQYIEEMQGYAAGAKVDFYDLWVLSIESDAEINRASAKCTNVITNSGKLIGHNEDALEPGMADTVCVVKKTIKDLTTLEICYYNTLGGNSVGISSYGYIHALNTLLFTDNQIGIPKNVIARYLLDSQNPDEAIRTILALPRASGYNHNIVSRNGQIWNLELTANDGIVTHPQLPFVHTNHCLNLPSDFNDDHGTISRLEFARQHVQDRMSVDQLQQLQEDVSQGPNNSVFNERTIGKIIVDFTAMTAYIWLLREKQLGWVSYPLDFIV